MTSYLFSPLSPSTPHNEPSREEEFLNNQSLSVQSVCLMECKQHAYRCTDTHCIYSDTWMHNGVWPSRRLQSQRLIVGGSIRWKNTSSEPTDNLDCDWSLGWSTSSYTIKGNILGLFKYNTACLHAAETHFSFFSLWKRLPLFGEVAMKRQYLIQYSNIYLKKKRDIQSGIIFFKIPGR